MLKKYIIAFLKKRLIKLIIGASLLVIVLTVTIIFMRTGREGKVGGAKEENKKPVVIAMVDLASDEDSFIDSVGTVKAEAQIDIISTAPGTVKGIFFEVSDPVTVNQLLVSLFDSATLTSLNNARTNLINTQGNLVATERITDETVRQAEIGVQSAQESVVAAEIGLQSTRDNLANATALRDKKNLDTKNNAVVSFNGYLNTIFSVLEDIDAIMDIEKEDQLSASDFTNPNLGAKNPESLNAVRASYRQASNLYNKLLVAYPTSESVPSDMENAITCLNFAEQAINNMIAVLNNTVTGINYPEATLALEKSNFIAWRATVIGSITSAKSISQTLQNLNLFENQEITSLENAVKAAQSQLAIAETGLANARISLSNTKVAKDQQSLVSQSSVDNARGQLSLARVQAGELTIKSPLSGVVTGKFIELGAEINPGQKIAEVSQNERVKIEVSLPSQDVYRIEKGQMVSIADGLIGKINSINPAADPITRKVKVEIIYDNQNSELIQGTFVDVSIPAKKLTKTHAESVFIPLKAVTIAQNESYVFIIIDNKAAKATVVTGKTEGALIEILDGLNQGDILVVEGAKNLKADDEVAIQNN